MKMYYEQDAKPEALRDKTIAILGYGSQGRAHALNLRDSGLKIVVGLRPDGATAAQARRDGFEVPPPHEAALRADFISVLTPDMTHKALFEQAIKPALNRGKTLLFAHGFTVHYGHVTPPKDVNVILVAPKGPGNLVRREYETGGGVPCLMAVWQDATGDAHAQTLAYAHALGGTRSAVLETTFAEETETDLFGEQAVLCGGMTELVKTGYETLVEAGYQPELAYFECLHELKLIVDLMYEGGLERVHRFISETASYGALTRGQNIVDGATRERMRLVLKDIQNGNFAKEWADAYAKNLAHHALREKESRHPLERIGKTLRSQMRWLSAQKKAA